MNVLGLKITGHDTGAALISQGRVIAIAEERLNRVKHSFNMFPELAIDYCLNALNVEPKEVNLIVIDQVGTRTRIRIKEMFLEKVGDRFPRASIEVINHHDAHAASAFFCSPFEEAAILVYDGSGEKFETHLGVFATETETLYRGSGNQFHQIQKTMHLREGKVFPYTFGVGKLYSLLSNVYLRFGAYNEGKMMGLAPYGDDSLLKKFREEMWFKEKDGHIVCNSRIAFPGGSKIKLLISSKSPQEILKRIIRKIKFLLKPLAKNLIKFAYSDFAEEIFVEPKIFPKIYLPKPPRPKDCELPDDYYTNVAYAGQQILEKVATLWGKKLKGITKSENLCVAGGVGLNIDANKRFLDTVGFKHVFIQPAASDTGIALGSALYGLHVILNQPRFSIMKNASLGKKYSGAEIKSAIEERKSEIVVKTFNNIAEETAKLISQGKIIGWFYGGSEYGPRALGHRSILADPRVKDMKDILNNKVKHREPWRPFAASILRESMSKYFELEEESPFMLLAAKVKEEKQKLIPSVVHVDGTSRIQSVTKEENGHYYDLIAAFNKITGVPLILNTSFNLAGEPIVETPKDALNCFLSTQMDFLVLENYLISKK